MKKISNEFVETASSSNGNPDKVKKKNAGSS